MINVAAVLKDLIRRVAKREVKKLTSTMKQAVARHRRDIADLKRKARAQEKETASLKAQDRTPPSQTQSEDDALNGVRFSARSVKAQRKRLNLSAVQYGKLVGVSPLTIYHWEHGKSRPRKAQFAALVAVRAMGKREALAKLDLLKAPRKPARRKPAAKKPARKKPARKRGRRPSRG